MALGKEPYFFLMNVHSVKTQVLAEILAAVHGLIVRFPRVGGMVFTERNIGLEPYAELFRNNHKFLQNIIYLPVYDFSESTSFLATLANEWGVRLTSGQIDQIARMCGGYLWLLREAVRLVRTTGKVDLKEIAESPGIRLRLSVIMDLLGSEEQVALARLCWDTSVLVDSVFTQYFLTVGLVRRSKHGFMLTCPLLEPFLRTVYAARRLEVSSERTVLLNGTDISDRLTKGEVVVLRLLVAHRTRLVSREQVAQTIWGNEWAQRYSDWAIDKAMSRLRVSLEKLGLSADTIQTKKGQGFLMV